MLEDYSEEVFEPKEETTEDNVSEEEETDATDFDGFEEENIVELLICDILKVQREDDYFIFKDISFNTILFMGVITQIGVDGDDKKFVVDDGTGCISCLMDDDFDSTEKEVINKDLEELYEEYQESRDDLLLKSTIMIKKSIKNILDEDLNVEDLSLGDNVKILGNLREYNNSRIVFIENIIVEDTEILVKHLENLSLLDEDN